jgi:GntR family transcriptional regulator
MTVSRAYSLLESEGLLERLRGTGMAVAAQARRARPESERLALLDPRMQDLARAARELELPASRVLRRLGQLLEDET